MNDKQVMAQEQQQENKMNPASPVVRLTPAVDIYETAAELVLLADLPGVEESGLQLEVSRGVLTLEGEIQTTESEEQRGYYRQFRLSERIDADAGSAALKDGVLTLRLPKSESAKPKKIAIKTLH
ncbi:MAG: Hsp20/alpha crystallin family protein [Desulfuromusa sp.]|nr:Hsp20/alpha crystallin family protein [Desulfuromusa sp.]